MQRQTNFLKTSVLEVSYWKINYYRFFFSWLIKNVMLIIIIKRGCLQFVFVLPYLLLLRLVSLVLLLRGCGCRRLHVSCC